ncbi:dolichyl-diphosphooligosaccharide--protein glycosyltransferase, putative [Plasmodium knowlesi strain H]|uniref:Dolichyl-diphosphooligosaccharide--protein glycosyltransferase 48 kDa subunit n=3 Tax=Plasmodium knowlesi TaxID=5850 RepID=A0A5K1UFP7_PLAKH|nr:dolichyl-diphosphooligosaccharide--protein glycosyltransferase subunit WBP1, putative [Plasmodium knowlesi strain H]OTN67343.1 Dolichyl-diphosphooligosaccharide--protein glycosyltransferase 48 kDa subunit [Plasmodium knowlesi]CAA9987466.1 dolichyl-diphosphooligosaccharide--protein glycosyltransferase subunit WBP1, putative [Plasmodium knowlesi strain H]SBO23220.1 dolichyl-diphosphooligosaccharide--protein glycosyltransferase, putative [Plasmodium knowlesi strain H]SBO24038.1 dolichyl-diphosp|eukprot:XP_002258467.1 dolichyl-diphosphooligosaccharide--protein-glyc ot ransferase, putative [Plasmodium knowlesi strain H]
MEKKKKKRVILPILILFLLISVQRFRCESIKLERVPFDRESIIGSLPNKIKKYEGSKVVLVSNIPNLSATHGEFLRMLNGEEGHHIGKCVHLGGDGDSDAMLPEDPAIYDGLVIILDVLDDQVVESLTTKYVNSFREKKKNVFLSLNSVNGKSGIQLLTQLHIQVYGGGSYVKDPFGKASQKGVEMPEGRINQGYAFYTGEIIRDTPIVDNPSGGKKKKFLLYQGTAHVMMGKTKNILEVVTCTQTCLVYDQNGNVMKKAKQGTNLSLVSSNQWDNNSRCVFSSSSEIFSDIFFHTNGENKKFAQEVVAWNFKKSGIIRYDKFKLYKDGDKKDYTAGDLFGEKLIGATPFFPNDFIHLSIDLYELKRNFWVPLKRRDIQYELVKMQIHRRDFLNFYKNAESPTYYKSFHLPKEHGVYKIKIYFRRKGYNVLNLHFFLPVRSPLHYDKNKKVHFEFYPFYTYIYLSLFCFFLFILVIMFDDSRGPAEDRGGQGHGKEKMD